MTGAIAILGREPLEQAQQRMTAMAQVGLVDNEHWCRFSQPVV